MYLLLRIANGPMLTPLWLVRVTPKRVLQPGGIAILEKWTKLALGCDKNLPLSVWF